MSFSKRSMCMIPVAISLTVIVGCGGQAEDEVVISSEMTAGSEMSAGAFNLPPAGITGTPADNATDPALRNLPNPQSDRDRGLGKAPRQPCMGLDGRCRYRTGRARVGL